MKNLNVNHISNVGSRHSRTCRTGWPCWVAVALLMALTPVMGQPTLSPSLPEDLSVSLNATAQFQVSAIGPGPFTYQWWFKDAPLDPVSNPKATDTLLVISNVNLTHAGNYWAVVSDTSGSATSRVATLNVDPTFVKITQGAIVNDSEASFNSVWWDYDNDGWLDLFVVNHDNAGARRNSLYHNLRDGTFGKVTNVINSTLTQSESAAAADFDNDGDEDLFVCSAGNVGRNDDCFRNEGGGVFTHLSQTQFGLAVGEGGWSFDVAWVDYDRDGFLDLFVVNGWPAGDNDCLYRNNGAGFFTKMTSDQVGPIVADESTGYACAWADEDGDGYPDVWVNSIGGGGGLYHNDGARGGIAFSHLTGGGVPPAGGVGGGNMGLGVWADFDNDGRLDLFLGGGGVEGFPNALYRNLGNHSFVNVAESAGVAEENNCWAAAWGDYDNDGWLDLFVANYEEGGRDVTNLFYHNRGDGTFEKLDVGSPIRDGDLRAATCWVDYDNDGWLDLFISCGNGTELPNLLYRNNAAARGNQNAWLKIRLVGIASNRQGLGAKVRVQATIAGKELSQLREITGNSDYSGAPGRLAHFGLGGATKADVVRIEWPSGIVQELHDVTPKQFLTVVEHQDYAGQPPSFTQVAPAENGAVRVTIAEPASGWRYVLEASANLVNWTKLAAWTSGGTTFQFTDTQAPTNGARFYRLVVP